MRHPIAVRWLTLTVAAFGALASAVGIFYRDGPGTYEYLTIRGDTVAVHGRGLYHHMSAEVAPQGIAQDVVTLFLTIPLLLFALRRAESGSVRGRLLLAGTLGYFLVSYLLYLAMAMYNALFLAYVVLLGASFFGLALVLLEFDVGSLRQRFSSSAPLRGAGAFLMLNAGLIALLWLGVVIPPLVSGAIVPPQVEHYTTLVVQGFDLALLLPLGAVSGWLILKRKPLGFLLAPTYMVFLALLMTALTAKIVAMGMLGYEIIPAIIVIPALNLVSATLAVRLLGSVSSSAGFAA